MGSVWSKTLFDRRRALIWWGIGFIVLTAGIISIFPSVRNSPELDKLTEELPAALKSLIGERSLTSPIGYVQSRLFQLMVPVLFLVFAIGQGAEAIAGEEHRKTMDLLLANPLSRTRVVVEKFAALCVQMVMLDALLFVSLFLLCRAFDLQLSTVGLAAASINALLFGLLFGAIALTLGAVTGHRGISVGIPTAAAIAAYVWESVTALVPELASYAGISPFHHYVASDPLVRGFVVSYLAAFMGISIILVLIATFTFSRRDLQN
ncbi:MAG TPA: ABC transporter permease subunit [Actinomycetota bacterium]|nr:ABC transporter permease subunit [Actinomycetota bacterium]